MQCDELTTTDHVLRLLGMLRNIRGTLPVDQLTHCLQAATRAEEGGADEDWIVAALCHDIGKVVPYADHAPVGAQLLLPFVRDEVSSALAIHDLVMIGDRRAREEPAYELASEFVEVLDQPSFDPSYATAPLHHFEPVVRHVFGREPRPRSPIRTAL